MTSPKWKHFPRNWTFVRGIHRSPVPGEFPAQRPVTRSFDVFFDLRLNKRLSKQSWGLWFESLSCPLWRHHKKYKMGVCMPDTTLNMSYTPHVQGQWNNLHTIDMEKETELKRKCCHTDFFLHERCYKASRLAGPNVAQPCLTWTPPWRTRFM